MCGETWDRPAARPRNPAALVLGGLAGLAAVGLAATLVFRGAGAGGGDCRQGKAAGGKKQYSSAPTEQLGSAATLVLDTEKGRIEIALDVERAPKTASSVAFLACDGFYDNLTFHRVVPGFVIQGGDPAGNGTGGPGFSVVEAPPKDLKYTEGIVAMAKTQREAPGTSGSQFFIVSGPEAVQLPAEYALVGKVASGMDVVATIESEGATKPVKITRATVEK